MLMVRSVARDDLARYFPKAKIKATPKGDYHYRVTLPASYVAKVVARSIEGITYDKMKPALPKDRYQHHLGVWCEMMDMQTD